jgi:tetratricopeptide (TPR) repeat protein
MKNIIEGLRSFATERVPRIGYILLIVMVIALGLAIIPIAGIDVMVAKGYLAILAGGVFALVFLVWFLLDGQLFPRRILEYVLLALPVVAIWSALDSPSLDVSLFGYGYQADAALFWIVASLVGLGTMVVIRKRPQRIGWVYFSLFLVFALLFLFQITYWISGGAFSLGSVRGTLGTLMGSWTDFLILTGFIHVSSLMSLLFMRKAQTLRTVMWVFLGLSGLVLLVADWGLVWGAIGLVSLMLFFFQLLHNQHGQNVASLRFRQLPLLPLIIFVIALIAPFVGTYANNLMTQYVVPMSFEEVRLSLPATLNSAWITIQDQPVVGAGPGMFDVSWRQTRSIESVRLPLTDASFRYGFSWYFTSWLTLGVFGGLLLTILFIRLASAVYRHTEEVGMATRRDYYLLTSLYGAIFFAFFLIMHAPGPVITLVAFMFIGMFLGIEAVPSPDTADADDRNLLGWRTPAIAALAKPIYIGVMILFVILGITASARALGNDIRVAKAAKAETVEERLSIVERAARETKYERYNFMLAEYWLQQALDVGSSDLLDEDSRRQEVLDRVSKAVQYAQASAEYNPTNYRNWLRLGDLYTSLLQLNIDGAYERAGQFYNEAGRWNVTGVDVPIRFAQLEIVVGNYEDAERYLTRVLQIRSGDATALLLMAQIYALQDDAEQALLYLEQAVRSNPTNAVALFALGQTYSNLGRLEDASVVLEQLLLVEPANIEVRYGLAQIYQSLELSDRANYHLDILEQLGVDLSADSTAN